MIIGESCPRVPDRNSLVGRPCLDHLGRVCHAVWVGEMRVASCGRMATGRVHVGVI